MKRSMKIVMGLMGFLLFALVFAVFNLAPAEGAVAMALVAPIVITSIQTSAEAKQERRKIWDQMEGMIKLRKDEKRAFTSDEEKDYNELRLQFDALTLRIDELEKDERRALIMAGAGKGIPGGEEKELKQFSFTKFIREVKNNNLSGFELEMHQEAVEENKRSNTGQGLIGKGIPSILFRSANGGSVTGGTAGEKGGILVPTEKSGLMETLRPLLVLSGLGANTIGGLEGNVDFPKGSNASATFKTELASADEYQMTFSKVSMTPKRLPAWAAYSNQLLNQSSPDVELFVRNQLLKAIAHAVEDAAINGTGTNQPTGIVTTAGIGSVVGGTAGLAPTWAHIVQLEEKVAVENAAVGQLAYLTNAKVRSKLKQTLKASGVAGYIWEILQSNAPLNSYPAAISSLVSSAGSKGGASNLSTIIFGDFSKLLIGQWGGLDIVVDPYTGAKTGAINIVVNSYWDSAVLEPKSFAAMLDAIT